METISAPNGTTKFLKPDFECKLYEESSSTCIIGYAVSGNTRVPMRWDSRGVSSYSKHFNLTPAPQPWYENLGRGKLCWVRSYSNEPKTAQMVVSACEDTTGSLQFHTPFHIYEYAQPLTPEEALEYLVKD